MRYFDTAGEHHHNDEEADLFPLVAARSGEAGGALQLIERLRADHAEMRSLWQVLRVSLQRIADASSAELDAQLVERFTRLYRTHIEVEEAELLPLADRVLDEQDHVRLGAAMAGRRGAARRFREPLRFLSCTTSATSDKSAPG